MEDTWNILEHREVDSCFRDHFSLPLNKSDKTKDNEEDIPEPDDEVDFINDDIESEDAESIESILMPSRAILVVCTTSNLQKRTICMVWQGFYVSC